MVCLLEWTACVLLLPGTMLSLVSADRPCPHAAKAGLQTAEQRVIQIYTELLKKRILDALGLAAPPNVTATRTNGTLPAAIEAGLRLVDTQSGEHSLPHHHRHEKADSEEGSDRQIFILGEEAPTCLRSKPASCFYFDLQQAVSGADSQVIFSAQLMMYKLRQENTSHNHSVIITTLNHPHHNITLPRIRGQQSVSYRENWIEFDVTHVVRRWMKGRRRPMSIMVECPSCEAQDTPLVAEQGEYRPNLVISTSKLAPRSSRTTRSVGGCRLRTRTTTFADVDVPYVLRPHTFQFGYCIGECSDADALPSHRFFRRTNHLSDLQRDLCCVPTSHRPMQVIYEREKDVFSNDNIEDILVDGCGCR